MSKKFEKLRISFGKRTESHKDKSWSTGLLLKIQQAKKILAVQSRALRKAAKLTPSQSDFTAEAEDQNKEGR